MTAAVPTWLSRLKRWIRYLKEIGADAPVLHVYNKIDLSGDAAKIIYKTPDLPDRVYVSAYSGQGLELLSQAVQQCLMGELQYFDLVLKPAYGKLRTQLYTLNVIQSEHHDDHGDLHLSVCIALINWSNSLNRHIYH